MALGVQGEPSLFRAVNSMVVDRKLPIAALIPFSYPSTSPQAEYFPSLDSRRFMWADEADLIFGVDTLTRTLTLAASSAVVIAFPAIEEYVKSSAVETDAASM